MVPRKCRKAFVPAFESQRKRWVPFYTTTIMSTANCQLQDTSKPRMFVNNDDDNGDDIEYDGHTTNDGISCNVSEVALEVDFTR